MKTSEVGGKQAVNGSLQAVNGSIGPMRRQTAPGAACKLCLLRLKPRPQKRSFCSDRHRLLYWAAGEILVEWKKGRADGLRDIIRELGKVKR
jgi:hypothetical protein